MLTFLYWTLLLGSFAAPQTARTARPAVALPMYDAVVIKPNNTGVSGINIDIGDTTFQARNVTARMLIVNATGRRPEQIFGFPAWAENSRFDVNAKTVDVDLELLQSLPREGRKAMLLAVLKDRFHLVFHMESKILPVYDMVVTRDGPKFKASVLPPDDQGSGSMTAHSTELKGRGVSLQMFAEHLEQQTDRTIIDKTGLTARYDLQLIWTSDSSSNSGQPDSPPTLFTALQEQLGLKLVASRGPVNTFIVDHIEPPSEN